MGTLNRLVVAGLAAAAAVVWAIGMTVWQPLSEPDGPDFYVDNNTYWPRELRWGALIALVLVLIVIARGSRAAILGATVAGVGGVVADLALDRFGQDVGTAGLVAAAVVAALLCCTVAMVVPVIPRPGVLFVVAVIAAVTSGFATVTESPTDVETGLKLGSAAVGSLLALVAVAAAALAGREQARIVLSAAVVAGAMPWLLRLAAPQPSGRRILAALVLIVLLVVTAAALAHRVRRPGRVHLGVAGITAGLLVVLFYPLVMASIILQNGAPFTRLAGNPPFEADEDVLLIVLGIPIGFVIGWALLAFLRRASDRTAVKDDRPAVAA